MKHPCNIRRSGWKRIVQNWNQTFKKHFQNFLLLTTHRNTRQQEVAWLSLVCTLQDFVSWKVPLGEQGFKQPTLKEMAGGGGGGILYCFICFNWKTDSQLLKINFQGNCWQFCFCSWEKTYLSVFPFLKLIFLSPKTLVCIWHKKIMNHE